MVLRFSVYSTLHHVGRETHCLLARTVVAGHCYRKNCDERGEGRKEEGREEIEREGVFILFATCKSMD